MNKQVVCISDRETSESEDESSLLQPVQFNIGSIVKCHGDFAIQSCRDPDFVYYGIVEETKHDDNKVKQIMFIADGDMRLKYKRSNDNTQGIYVRKWYHEDDLILVVPNTETSLPNGMGVDHYGLPPFRYFEHETKGNTMRWKAKYIDPKDRCDWCRSPWCHWNNDTEADLTRAISWVERTHGRKEGREQRKICYRHFVLNKYGGLGPGNRRRCGVCAEYKICKRFPNKNEFDAFLSFNRKRSSE